MPAPGRLGRLPRDTSRFAPTLERYLSPGAAGGLLPVADSEDVDRASKVTSVPMYGNDTIGDCTIAGMAHGFTAMSVFAGNGQPLFADSEIITAYSAVSGYNPADGSNDNGAQMQDALNYMRLSGMTDISGKVHRVTAYAALGDPANVTLLSECLKTFGTAYIGVNLQQAQEGQFGNRPWAYVPGSPVLGGHAISLHRRQPYGSRIGVFAMSSWGALQPSTISFIRGCVEEAWVFVTDDWLEANGDTPNGLDLAQLQADMTLV